MRRYSPTKTIPGAIKKGLEAFVSFEYGKGRDIAQDDKGILTYQNEGTNTFPYKDSNGGAVDIVSSNGQNGVIKTGLSYPKSADVTITVGVKFDNVSSTNNWMFELQAPGNDALYLWWTSNNQYGLGTNNVVFGWNNGGFRDNTIAWTPRVNTFYILTVRYDSAATTLELFVNGESIGTASQATTPPTSGTYDEIYLGVQQTANATPCTLDGRHYGAMYHSRALTDGEIKKLHGKYNYLLNAGRTNYRWFLEEAAPAPSVTEIPPQLHMLDKQFATITAHRLGGVIEQ